MLLLVIISSFLNFVLMLVKLRCGLMVYRFGMGVCLEW